MNVVTAAVIRLEAEGWPEPIFAWRRWADPQPGQAVIVLSAADDWAATKTSAQLPSLRVLIYAAPTDSPDAEALAVEVGDRVRSVLHRAAGGVEFWGDLRVLSSLHVGSGLGDVEGHQDWRCRSLTFEIQVA